MADAITAGDTPSNARFTPTPSPWIAGAAVAAILHALRVFQTTISDDAYILYRYAAHLASGHGLVWNLGEAPIEGFTSLLDVLGLAAAQAAGFDLIQAGQSFGVVFAALACVAAGWLGHEASGGDARVAVLSAWMVALAPPNAVWARGGMETSLFTCLAALAMATWMWERRTSSGRLWSGTAFLLAVLARPEAIALAGLAIVFDAMARRRSAIAWWPFLAGLAVFGIWKLSYFGDLLPNTYYAKTGGGFPALKEGSRYVLRFLRDYGAVNLLLAIVPAIALRPPLRWRIWYLLTSVGVLSLHVASVGGDYQFFGRYLVPILPWLAVLTVSGGVRCWEAASSLPSRRRVAFAAVVVVAGVVELTLPSMKELWDRPWLLTRPWRLVGDIDPMLFRPDFELMGKALATIAGPGDTVAALAVGAIGYFSDRPILDCLGLNDRQIARLPVVMAGRTTWRSGHMKGNAALIVSRRPDVIVLPMRPTSDPCRLPSPSEIAVYPFVGDLLNLPEFRTDYRQRASGLPDGRWINYFVRGPGRPPAPGTRVCADDAGP